MINHTETRPGLVAPVDDAQRIVKAALTALSRPGLPVRLADLPPSPHGTDPQGPGMSRGMTALALTLCDTDTPVWLDAACDTADVRRHLLFHCGCPLTQSPSEAAFTFIGDARNMPYLHAFRQGVPEYPDRSMTLITRAELTAVLEGPFEESEQEMYELAGPGIRADDGGNTLFCTVGGLPGWFRWGWSDNNRIYPLGVNVLFVDDSPPLRDAAPHALNTGLPRNPATTSRDAVVTNDRDAASCSRFSPGGPSTPSRKRAIFPAARRRLSPCGCARS